MKRYLLLSGLLFQMTLSAQVGINTTTPAASSALDINVNSLPANGKKGLLIPQVALTGTQDVTTIPNPANGLMVYNTTSAGTSPNNVVQDSFYKYNVANTRWELLINQTSLATLNVPVIGNILGFLPTGNDTTYLGSDLGANIRQVNFDNIRLQTAVGTFNNTTKEFTANRTGYYNFQVNLVFRGPYSGIARLGVSKPYAGAKPTTAGNGTFAFFTQNTYSADASTPVAMAVNGLLFMNSGEKILFLTRYITPTTNTLDVEGIAYDRTFVNSVNVIYYSN